MPKEAKSYTDQIQLLLTANEKSGAEQVARAFQDLTEQRLRECFAAIKRDEKAERRVDGLKGGRAGEVMTLLKNIHDVARALHSEIDLSGDSSWARQLAALRAAVAKLLEAEIDSLPGQVRRLLRPHSQREMHHEATLDEGEVAG